MAQPLDFVEGWDGKPIEAWRLTSFDFMTTTLQQENSVYHDWLAGEINLRFALSNSADWARFWFYDVAAQNLPQMWLRWSMEFMQLFHKVTDGTPVDAQIASYISEVDLIVSADKRFVSMCKRIRREAPFQVADAKTISAGQTGLEELFQLIRRDDHQRSVRR